MNIETSITEITNGKHDNIITFGVGNKENPDSLSFYTSNPDFDWVLFQLARGQFNLLSAQAKNRQDAEDAARGEGD